MRKMLAIGTIAAFMACSCNLALAAEESRAQLLSEAKISEAQAKQIAMGRVRNGVIKSAELEREHGLLIWSFDVAQPSSRGVTEIQVDAKTGKIASMKQETAAAEARELKAERHKPAPK